MLSTATMCYRSLRTAVERHHLTPRFRKDRGRGELRKHRRPATFTDADANGHRTVCQRAPISVATTAAWGAMYNDASDLPELAVLPGGAQWAFVWTRLPPLAICVRLGTLGGRPPPRIAPFDINVLNVGLHQRCPVRPRRHTSAKLQHDQD